MKLYCDEMLIRIGHWLRAAGYDTKIASHAQTDRQILEQAVNENRKLITRDRKLAEFREARNTVVLLGCNGFLDCIAEITASLNINWLYRPFSRCLVCNTPLIPASVQQVTHLNELLKNSVNNIYYCRACEQLFWEGSHVARMRARLVEFNRHKQDF